MNKKLILYTILTSLFIVSCGKNKDVNKNEKVKIESFVMTESSAKHESEVLINSLDNIINPNQNKESENIDTNSVDISMIPLQYSTINQINLNTNHRTAIFSNIDSEYTKYLVNNISNVTTTSVYLFTPSGDDEFVEKIYCSSKDNESNIEFRANALKSYVNSLSIKENNRNCDKDGLILTRNYLIQNFGSDYNSKLPIVIFDDGKFVLNANNASYELINEYNK